MSNPPRSLVGKVCKHTGEFLTGLYAAPEGCVVKQLITQSPGFERFLVIEMMKTKPNGLFRTWAKVLFGSGGCYWLIAKNIRTDKCWIMPVDSP